jgi:hypothetical protein
MRVWAHSRRRGRARVRHPGRLLLRGLPGVRALPGRTGQGTRRARRHRHPRHPSSADPLRPWRRSACERVTPTICLAHSTNSPARGLSARFLSLTMTTLKWRSGSSTGSAFTDIRRATARRLEAPRGCTCAGDSAARASPGRPLAGLNHVESAKLADTARRHRDPAGRTEPFTCARGVHSRLRPGVRTHRLVRRRECGTPRFGADGSVSWFARRWVGSAFLTFRAFAGQRCCQALWG